MKRTRMLSLLAVTAAAAMVVGVAPAVSGAGHASLVIRHQVRGCHAWSLNGGAYLATQKVSLQRGGWLTIVNNDMMTQKLVQTAGPAASIRNVKTPFVSMGIHGTFGPGMMAHMGAEVKVTFTHAGTYRFTTKVGEDYMEGMKTIGEDNVLRLTVTVS